MKNNLPKRKPTRLKEYDYSTSGAYFVTICVKDRKQLLSKIVGDDAYIVPKNHLSNYGSICDKYIYNINIKYENATIDKYVIMPNHIHVIMILSGRAAGASPRPTITDIVCTYKSLTTRECKKSGFREKLFQTSFYEHVIRSREDYEKIAKYIYENPIRWCYDELYTEE